MYCSAKAFSLKELTTFTKHVDRVVEADQARKLTFKETVYQWFGLVPFNVLLWFRFAGHYFVAYGSA